MADEATEEVSLLFRCFQVLWLHSDDSLEQALKIRAFLSTLFGLFKGGMSLAKPSSYGLFPKSVIHKPLLLKLSGQFMAIGRVLGLTSLGWPQALGYVC